MSTAISFAPNGSTIYVTHGFLQETNWNLTGKSLTLVPQGSVTVYNADPFVNDSDGDGIPDGWEMLYGLNPTNSADATQPSLFPWAQAQGLSNLQVYQLGFDPRTPPVITPHILPSPNAAGWNTNTVSVYFSVSNGLAGIAWYTPTGTNTFNSETNDAVIVCTAVNDAGILTQSVVSINIDTTSPTLRLIPGHGETNDASYSLLTVEYSDPVGQNSNVWPSGLNLDSLHIMLGSDNVTTNFCRFGNGAVLSTNLAAGSYEWTVSIADNAGNVTTTSVTFYATGAANTNAPVISNADLGTGLTLMPDVPQIWVQGKVSGSNSTVSASVNGGDLISMNRRDDVFGYLLPLDFGTNVIVLVATDATGSNAASQVFFVERSDRYQAQITSHQFGEFVNAPTTKVAVAISPTKVTSLGTTTTVNYVEICGVPASLNSNGDYETDTAISVCAQSIWAVVVTIHWLDGTIDSVPLGLLEAYVITAKWTKSISNSGSATWGTSAWPCGSQWRRWVGGQGLYELFSNPCTGATNFMSQTIFTHGGADPDCVDFGGVNNLDLAESNAVPVYSNVMQPGRGLKFGSEGGFDYDLRSEWGAAYPTKTTWDGSLTFVAPFYYPSNTTVIFTFEGVDYARTNDLDLSQVTYLGHSPTNWDNNAHTVSYLITVDGGKSYVIDKTKFSWPTGYDMILSTYFDYSETNANWFSFGDFHNGPPSRCEVVYYLGHDTDAKKALDDWNKKKIPGDQWAKASANGCNIDGTNGEDGIPNFISALASTAPEDNRSYIGWWDPNTGFKRWNGETKQWEWIYQGRYPANGGQNPNGNAWGTFRFPMLNSALGFLHLASKNWTSTLKTANALANNEDGDCPCRDGIKAKFIYVSDKHPDAPFGSQTLQGAFDYQLNRLTPQQPATAEQQAGYQLFTKTWLNKDPDLPNMAQVAVEIPALGTTQEIKFNVFYKKKSQ